MECKRNLKFGFIVLLIYILIEMCIMFLSWNEEVKPIIFEDVASRIRSHHKYLWRPFTNNYSSITSDSDDRVADQLEWTKKLFQSENREKFPVKNLLLVFGNWGREFWGTHNRILCPGFSINEEKCRLTTYRSGDAVGNYDAVIYTQDGKRKNFGEHVKEFMYETEPPPHSFNKLNPHTLWVSYYRGSDIVIPYYKWVAFDEEKSEYFNPGTKKDYLLASKDFSTGKFNFAVAFASNCQPESNRFGYITELKKYISVDVFGNCGTKPPCTTNNYSCLQSVVKKYKFYLAFENSNCRDYITEKVFKNALENGVVPVVMGAHPDDYRAVAPPHSYVHVDDFQSPKHLAEYLTLLDKNNTLYNEYFKWKGTGFFYEPFKDVFCRLCGMLFYYDYVPPRYTWTENETWATINRCLPKGQWNWNSNN